MLDAPRRDRRGEKEKNCGARVNERGREFWKLTDRDVVHRLCKTFLDCYKAPPIETRLRARDVSWFIPLGYYTLSLCRAYTRLKIKKMYLLHCYHVHTLVRACSAYLRAAYSLYESQARKKNHSFEFIAYNMPVRGALVTIKNQRYLLWNVIYRITLLFTKTQLSLVVHNNFQVFREVHEK